MKIEYLSLLVAPPGGKTCEIPMACIEVRDAIVYHEDRGDSINDLVRNISQYIAEYDPREKSASSISETGLDEGRWLLNPETIQRHLRFIKVNEGNETRQKEGISSLKLHFAKKFAVLESIFKVAFARPFFSPNGNSRIEPTATTLNPPVTNPPTLPTTVQWQATTTAAPSSATAKKMVSSYASHIFNQLEMAKLPWLRRDVTAAMKRASDSFGSEKDSNWSQGKLVAVARSVASLGPFKDPSIDLHMSEINTGLGNWNCRGLKKCVINYETLQAAIGHLAYTLIGREKAYQILKTAVDTRVHLRSWTCDTTRTWIDNQLHAFRKLRYWDYSHAEYDQAIHDSATVASIATLSILYPFTARHEVLGECVRSWRGHLQFVADLLSPEGRMQDGKIIRFDQLSIANKQLVGESLADARARLVACLVDRVLTRPAAPSYREAPDFLETHATNLLRGLIMTTTTAAPATTTTKSPQDSSYDNDFEDLWDRVASSGHGIHNR